MQVVVAQYREMRLAQRHNSAQYFQRLAAAVDQVAGQAQAVGCGVEGELVQQSFQRLPEALDIADVDVPAPAHGLSSRFLTRSAMRSNSASESVSARRPGSMFKAWSSCSSSTPLRVFLSVLRR